MLEVSELELNMFAVSTPSWKKLIYSIAEFEKNLIFSNSILIFSKWSDSK
jgi:hypothetical protein